jgi:hypothetical protein
MGTFDSIYQRKIRQLEEENRQLRNLISEAGIGQDILDLTGKAIKSIARGVGGRGGVIGRIPRPGPRKPAPPLRPGDTLPGNPAPPLRPGDTLPSYDPPSLPPLRPGDTL